MSPPRGKIHAGFSLAALVLFRWLTSANGGSIRGEMHPRSILDTAIDAIAKAARSSEDDSLTPLPPLRPLRSITVRRCFLKMHEIVNSSALGSAKRTYAKVY